MISSELQQVVADARATLQRELEPPLGNSVPEGISRPAEEGFPAEYMEFLAVANGGIFGRVVIFDINTVREMQIFADKIEGVPVQLGRDSWFCFGTANDDPLFIKRRDGSVWAFRDEGVIWWQSDEFERLADSLGNFLEKYVFGVEYPLFSGARENDEWRRLLVRIGRTQ